MGYSKEDYFAECLSIAADECGLELTPYQLQYLADAVSEGVENMSMAFGHDVASANFSAREAREKDEMAQRLRHEQECPTKRCEYCRGHGFTTDGWGRQFGCSNCGGKGQIALYQFKYDRAAGAAK